MSTADAKPVTAPRLDGPAPHLLVVQAPYYEVIGAGLLAGAARILTEAGATHDVLDVAGALELAAAIRLATAGTRAYHGYIALGCVVKGDTDHYDHVCREAMAGLTAVSLQFGLCLGNGLLTVHSERQALDRATLDGANKGAEAAAAALLQIRAARWLGAA